MAALVRTATEVITLIANGQHGVVARWQLLREGLTRHEIQDRLRNGYLIRVYRGVYRVGHIAPSDRARYMAAVLACGEGAVLSGLAAAHLLGLVREEPDLPQVTAPYDRRVKGIRVRRARNGLHRDDAIAYERIAVTTVARTLVDVAPLLGDEQLGRACHEAGVRFRTTPSHVQAVLRRRPNSPGAGRLIAVMRGDTKITLSRLESAFLALLRKEGLELPQTNRPAGGHYVDCRWPDKHLTVELDSYRFHNSRHSWKQDRKREREARARGDEFRRYTWDDVEQPQAMLAELRRLLSAGGASSRASAPSG